HGIYCFKISGEVYHLVTSALVQESEQPNAAVPAPQYGQLFVYDPEAAVNYRMHRRENAECDRQIMQMIYQVMRQHNPYARMNHNLHEAGNSEEDRARTLGIQPTAYELQF